MANIVRLYNKDENAESAFKITIEMYENDNKRILTTIKHIKNFMIFKVFVISMIILVLIGLAITKDLNKVIFTFHAIIIWILFVTILMDRNELSYERRCYNINFNDLKQFKQVFGERYGKYYYKK